MARSVISASIKNQNTYRWIIFTILAGCYLLVYFHRLCPAVLAVDMMRDLQAGGALTGFLGAAYFYPYAIMQLPAGLLADSWGPRNSITLFFIIAFIGSLLLGFAPTVLWAIVGRTLVGLGVAMLFVPTMKILAEWFHPSEFAPMTGILMAVGGLGSLSAATPLALLNSWIGWRFSFVTVGFFTLLLAVMVWLVVRDRPEKLGWQSVHSPALLNIPKISLAAAVRKVLSCRFFWPLAVWFFFDCGIFFSFGGLWGGPYLAHVYGFSKAQSANILSMLAIGMIVGSPLLSVASNRLFKGRKPVIVISAIVTVGLTICLAFFTDSMPAAGLYLLCFAMGVFSSAVVVVAFTANKELFPVGIAGTATGLINLFPFAGGAVFQPILGFVLESRGVVDGRFALSGYQLAFQLLFASALIALVASLFIKETLDAKTD
jgi:sugar phosphate permease